MSNGLDPTKINITTINLPLMVRIYTRVVWEGNNVCMLYNVHVCLNKVVVCIACDHHVKPLSSYHNRCYSIVFLSLNELTSGGRSIREKFTTSILYNGYVL